MVVVNVESIAPASRGGGSTNSAPATLKLKNGLVFIGSQAVTGLQTLVHVLLRIRVISSLTSGLDLLRITFVVLALHSQPPLSVSSIASSLSGVDFVSILFAPSALGLRRGVSHPFNAIRSLPASKEVPVRDGLEGDSLVRIDGTNDDAFAFISSTLVLALSKSQ